MLEQIILVDANDNQIGTEEKLKAHQKGKLHRAFSVLVFNSKNELLLQKRGQTKYHLPDLWSNTCCSHPRERELILEASHRRLKEEMGIDCELKEIFSFIYQTDFVSGLREHEYDHVLVGKFDGEPKPDPKEAADYKWISIDELKKDIKQNSEKYTPWFKIILKKYLKFDIFVK